jgi:hypothetical protein
MWTYAEKMNELRRISGSFKSKYYPIFQSMKNKDFIGRVGAFLFLTSAIGYMFQGSLEDIYKVRDEKRKGE